MVLQSMTCLAAAYKAHHFISPNLHVILVHFPLGIFVFGLFLEVFSFLWRRSSVRVGARWMILFGGLLSAPAALSGIDALQDVADNSSYKSDEGERIKGLNPTQWEYMQKHVLFTSIGAGLAAIGVTVGLGATGRWERRLYLPLLAVLAAAAGLMTFGAHFGGEGIYLEQVAVQLRGQPATGLEYFAPARSIHVLLAGLGIAFTLGALGTSFRAVSVANEVREEAVSRAELDALVNPSPSPAPGPVPPPQPLPRRVTDDASAARTLNDADFARPRVPSSRFWLMGALLFLLTLILGVWFLESVELSRSVHDLSPTGVSKDVWDIAWPRGENAPKGMIGLNNRRGAHIVFGVALFILPLVLAAAVRWGARRRTLVHVLCGVMVLLVALEIWLGVLLIYRGSEGPIYKFSSPPSVESMLTPSWLGKVPSIER